MISKESWFWFFCSFQPFVLYWNQNQVLFPLSLSHLCNLGYFKPLFWGAPPPHQPEQTSYKYAPSPKLAERIKFNISLLCRIGSPLVSLLRRMDVRWEENCLLSSRSLSFLDFPTKQISFAPSPPCPFLRSVHLRNANCALLHLSPFSSRLYRVRWWWAGQSFWKWKTSKIWSGQRYLAMQDEKPLANGLPFVQNFISDFYSFS